MSRKPSGPTQSKQLSLAEKQAAVGRLESRIKELRDLSVTNLQSGHDPSVTDLEGRIRSTLASGQDSSEYARLEVASNLDATVYVLSFDGRQNTPTRSSARR